MVEAIKDTYNTGGFGLVAVLFLAFAVARMHGDREKMILRIMDNHEKLLRERHDRDSKD